MKINILFMLYMAKTNGKGMCPIRCRVTYKKVRKQFSTGQFINPSNWNSKQQQIEPPEPDAELISSQLSQAFFILFHCLLFLPNIL